MDATKVTHAACSSSDAEDTVLRPAKRAKISAESQGAPQCQGESQGESQGDSQGGPRANIWHDLRIYVLLYELLLGLSCTGLNTRPALYLGTVTVPRSQPSPCSMCAEVCMRGQAWWGPRLPAACTLTEHTNRRLLCFLPYPVCSPSPSEKIPPS